MTAAPALQRLREWGPAVVVFLLGIALWEGYTRGLDVEEFLLPPLSDILRTLWDDRSTFLNAGWFTFKEALGGYLFFEADDLDAAIELASRIPAARMGGAVEVRPLKEQ